MRPFTRTKTIAPVIHNLTGDERVLKGIIIPDNTILCVVRTLVDPSWPWPDAIAAAGPDTPTTYAVNRVGDLYPPELGEPKLWDLYLFGPNKYILDIRPALAWGEQNKLPRSKPRHIYAAARDNSTLHHVVGKNPMAVFATEECSFEGRQHMPYAWWYDSKREARLSWTVFDFLVGCLFGFSRESLGA